MVERSLSGRPINLLILDALNHVILMFSILDWSLYEVSFVCTLWTGYCELLKSTVTL